MPRRIHRPRRRAPRPAPVTAPAAELHVNAGSVAAMSAGYRLVGVECGTPIYAYVDSTDGRPAAEQ